MLVVLGIVLYVAMDIILFVAKHIVAIGNDLQQIDRLITASPGCLVLQNAAGRSKGCYLVLHIAYAMVNQHGAHGEARPVDAVCVDVVAFNHLVNGLTHEVLVVGATNIPSVTIAAQIGHHELGGVNQVIHLVRAILILRVLVHAVSDDKQWRLGRQGVGHIDHHVP